MPSRLPDWLPLAIILLLATVLRFYRLGAENFWIDEIFSLRQIQPPLDAMEGFWTRTASRPLSLTLLYYSRQLGDSEFLARLPFAILGIINVAVLYALAREVAARSVALRASLFLALLPIHIWYSQEARWYTQWALLATLSYYALVRFWDSRRVRWWIGYVATAVASLYTYVVSLLLLGVHYLSGLLLPSRPGVRWKVLAGVLLAAVFAVPAFFVAAALPTGDGGGGVGTARQTSPVVLPYLLFAYVAGYTIGPTIAELHAFPSPASILRGHPEVVLYYAVFVTVSALGLWALRGRRTAGAILIPWVVVLPLLVFLGALLGGQTFNVRYTLAAVPGFVLLLSLGVEALGRWRLAGTVLVCTLFAFSLSNYYWDSRYDKEDVRGAIGAVREGPHGAELVAVVGQAGAAAEYYGEGLDVELLRGCLPGIEIRQTRVPQIEIAEVRTRPSFWLLVSRDWRGRSERCMEKLGATHRVAEHESYTGVDLYLMRQR